MRGVEMMMLPKVVHPVNRKAAAPDKSAGLCSCPFLTAPRYPPAANCRRYLAASSSLLASPCLALFPPPV
eukprot:767546-Hanusia_phi.AAC.1